MSSLFVHAQMFNAKKAIIWHFVDKRTKSCIAQTAHSIHIPFSKIPDKILLFYAQIVWLSMNIFAIFVCSFFSFSFCSFTSERISVLLKKNDLKRKFKQGFQKYHLFDNINNKYIIRLFNLLYSNNDNSIQYLISTIETTNVIIVLNMLLKYSFHQNDCFNLFLIFEMFLPVLNIYNKLIWHG